MEKIRQQLLKHEDIVPWMYLDTTGHVTVGVGTYLKNAGLATNLPFYHEKTGKPATNAEVEAAFKRVAEGKKAQLAAAKKFTATYYESETDLRVPKPTATAFLDTHIEADYLHLKTMYPGFEDFPEGAKVALFDMIYNLGGGIGETKKHKATGLHQFVNMNAAIRKGDWGAAAKCCKRHQLSLDRNLATARLFESAVPKTTESPAPTPSAASAKPTPKATVAIPRPG
jgi:GH24 family phage-related lysozyme (muramidase)